MEEHYTEWLHEALGKCECSSNFLRAQKSELILGVSAEVQVKMHNGLFWSGTGMDAFY